MSKLSTYVSGGSSGTDAGITPITLARHSFSGGHMLRQDGFARLDRDEARGRRHRRIGELLGAAQDVERGAGLDQQSGPLPQPALTDAVGGQARVGCAAPPVRGLPANRADRCSELCQARVRRGG